MTREPDPAYCGDPTLDGFPGRPLRGSYNPCAITSEPDPGPGARDELHEHRDDPAEHVHPAEQPCHPPVFSPWEMRTIGRRLRLAADSMGIGITRSFAERMATEGLRRAPEVGLTKTGDTVIFFVEPPGAKTTTILGWADRQSFFYRFTTTPAHPFPDAPSAVDPINTAIRGPEL